MVACSPACSGTFVPKGYMRGLFFAWHYINNEMLVVDLPLGSPTQKNWSRRRSEEETLGNRVFPFWGSGGKAPSSVALIRIE